MLRKRVQQGAVVLRAASLVLPLLSLVVAGNSHAADHQDWVALAPGAPPGTPPTVTFDAIASNEQQSFFDVVIPGFWVEDVTDTSGTIAHEKIFVPGHGMMRQIGAPQLPRIQFQLAVVTDATSLSVLQYTENASQTLTNYYPWPSSELELDHPEGDPEGYERDDRIYAVSAQWPTSDFNAANPIGNSLGSIQGTTVEVFPFKSNPVTRELEVVTSFRIGVAHPGVVGPQRLLTKERIRLAASIFDNWPSATNNLAPNDIKFEAEYLIIYPPEVEADIQPIVDLKKVRGYRVTQLPIQPSWTTCVDFRGQIQAWYNSTPVNKDHYCLLVGDVDKIPTCISPPLGTESYPGGVETDDLYGTIDGDDLNEEVYVGRISYDDTTDLRGQIEKIVHYQTVAEPGADYHEALLVAHREEAPEKYEAAHESVRNAFYVDPPTFITRYGSNFQFNNDSAVRSDINNGVGVVAYRGHGSSSAWTEWYSFSGFWDESDVNLLDNDPFTPVVWSFACQNSRIDFDDCLGEIFMEQKFGEGAVSHYGSTRNSYTIPNHELDRQMFQAVYTVGLTTQSHAIQYAELAMASLEDFHNAWMYMLLGDPDMEIRRGNPSIWDIATPTTVPPCSDNCPPFELTILDDQGQPLEGVLIAAWKEGFLPSAPNAPAVEVDELLDNRYTNALGQVQIPVNSLTEGILYYTVQNELGDTVLDSVIVGDVVSSGVPTVRPVSLTATPSVFQDATTFQFGQALPRGGSLVIYDTSGRLVERMLLSKGDRQATWRGRSLAGNRVPAGIYFAKLIVGSSDWKTKVVLVR